MVDYPRSKGALATIALKAVEDPLEFGIVITRDDGSIERFLEKPTWGQVFSDTINTGIYVLEPEIFDFIPSGRPVDFSEEVFPAVLESGKPLFGARRRRLLGGRRHPRGLCARPPGHPRREGGGPGERLPAAARCVVGQGSRRSTRRAAVRGPAIIGDNCHIGADAIIGEYCVLGANVRIGGQLLPRADRGPRQRLPRRRRPPRGLRPRPLLRPPPGCPLRGGRGPRRRDLHRGPGHPQVGREGLPVQDGRGGRHRQHLHRLGVPRAHEASSAAWASRAWPTSTSAPSWPCGSPWPGPPPWSRARPSPRRVTPRRAARVLKRAIMVGCNAAGVNVDDLEVATVPVTRFQSGPVRAWAVSPSGSSSTTPSR